MGKYEESLIGKSTHLMEIDDEEDNLEPEIDADITDICNHFNDEEMFKFIYLNLYNEIKSLDNDRKKELCQKLEIEFVKLYNFEFTPKINFDSDESIDNFLKFIEFIEFNNIDFLADMISGLDYNLLKKNVNEFVETNWNKIDEKLNYLIRNEKLSELISVFFRTNNRQGIIEFFKNKLKKDKMLVILKAMEGELQNERNGNN